MSGDTIRDAWVTAERYLQIAASQPSYVLRPDERGLILPVGDCEPTTDIRLPHVATIPLTRRALSDYLLSERRVFLWLWLHNDVAHCPFCLSGEVEERETGYREVIDVDEVIILVYKTYQCNGMTHAGQIQPVFSTLHEDFRKRLPNAIQNTFPAVCTLADEGVGPGNTKLLSKRLHNLVTGFTGSPAELANFVGQINRYHFHKYQEMKALYYCDLAERQELLRGVGQRDNVELIHAASTYSPFPDFNDKGGWAGETITYQWMLARYGNEILGQANRGPAVPPVQGLALTVPEITSSLQPQHSPLARFQPVTALTPVPRLPVEPATHSPTSAPLLLFRALGRPEVSSSNAAQRPPAGPPQPWMPLKGKGRGGAGGTRECPRCFKETGVHIPYKGHRCPYKEQVKKPRED